MKKRPRRIVRRILMIPVIAVLAVTVWGFLDATEGAEARTVWNYTWPGQSGGIRGGYLVDPARARRMVEETARDVRIRVERSPDGRLPAVLLIHEWWGLNLETARMAERLAADGYIVLAPDLLRGRLSVTMPGALVQMALSRNAHITDDLDLAYRQLQAIPEVDPERVAIVGFCFGGTQAMNAGLRHADAAAVGIFYGGGPITDGDELGHLGSDVPVFGAYGREDRTISTDDVQTFSRLLEGRGQPVDISIYDGVGHAFVSPQSLREDATAAQAWRDMRSFLAEHI
jgi:carboxymethylenebutenolidase